MNGVRGFEPGILEGFGRAFDLRIEPAAYAFAVLQQHLPDFLDAYTLDEAVRTFQIFCVFAVVLNETADVLENVIVRIHRAQHIAFAHPGSGGAPDVDFPSAAFDSDDTYIFDHRFSTVARAARRGHLDLVRRFHALELFLDLDAEAGAIADTVSAELFPDAGFHR